MHELCGRGSGEGLPFFIPRRLVEFDYFPVKKNKDSEEVERYRDDIDFAFFAVHLHYSRSDYEELTPLQKVLIMKEYENYVISTTEHIRNAVMNAEYNVNRKKGKKFLALWKKQPKKADMNLVNRNKKLIEEANRNDGNWIDKILKANGIKKVKKRKKNNNEKVVGKEGKDG